jgi:hypothetical protein
MARLDDAVPRASAGVDARRGYTHVSAWWLAGWHAFRLTVDQDRV